MSSIKYNSKEIGNRIRDCRLKANFSQRDLALLIGVSRQCIYDYERGRFIPKHERANAIAQVLKVPVEYLYHGVYSDVNEINEIIKAMFLLLRSDKFILDKVDSYLVLKTDNAIIKKKFSSLEQSFHLYKILSAESYHNIILEIIDNLE